MRMANRRKSAGSRLLASVEQSAKDCLPNRERPNPDTPALVNADDDPYILIQGRHLSSPSLIGDNTIRKDTHCAVQAQT